jgi:hypothetical protein
VQHCDTFEEEQSHQDTQWARRTVQW